MKSTSLPLLVDHLAECNNLQVPPDQFHASFCSRCYQATCTRSVPHHSGGLFEERVKTWEDRLFLNVPRKDPKDAPEIASKEFKEVNLTRWADPHSTPKAMGAVPVSFEAAAPNPENASKETGAISDPSLGRRNTPNPGPVVLPGSPRVVRPGATICLDDDLTPV